MIHPCSRSISRLRSRVIRLVSVGLALSLAACTQKDQTESASVSSSSDAIEVVSTDDKCELSATTAGSGNIVFNVRNDGSQVTEFYLFGEDGVRIVGEVENVGPGISRKLIASAAPGKYVTMCKPGMVGTGMRADFVVTDSGADLNPSGAFAEQLTEATAQYSKYVNDQAAKLLAGTEAFVTSYKAGADDTARTAYAPTRMFWERIEPVAESFGDLDPKLDAREADLEAGQAWTGWHRIEKDLWPPTDPPYTQLTTAQRATVADQLLADTKVLHERLLKLTYTPSQLGNGAKELLDEVATGKVTGEEEIWSRTDLWDFQANVEGAHEAFEALEPVAVAKDPKLVELLDAEFAAVQKLLDSHKVGDGFKLYNQLSAQEIKALADAVNALSEPLSRLTAAVVL